MVMNAMMKDIPHAKLVGGFNPSEKY